MIAQVLVGMRAYGLAWWVTACTFSSELELGVNLIWRLEHHASAAEPKHAPTGKLLQTNAAGTGYGSVMPATSQHCCWQPMTVCRLALRVLSLTESHSVLLTCGMPCGWSPARPARPASGRATVESTVSIWYLLTRMTPYEQRMRLPHMIFVHPTWSNMVLHVTWPGQVAACGSR
jgi:hypothetical protein